MIDEESSPMSPTTSPMSPTIRVNVKLFAVYQEAFQVPELQLELPIASPVAAVRDRLIADRPALAAWRDLTQFGVNLEHVPADHPLQEGDEVVLIPPVSGG
jgi:sulfur-carrier protein